MLAGRRTGWTSRAADKIVYSKSWETVSTPKTRLEREFHPQVVRELKAQSPLDISVAGPTLAAHAIRTGLVDEHHLLVVPTLLGGGIRVLPSNVRIRLDLLVKGRFAQSNSLSSLSRAAMMEAVAAGSEPRSRFEVLLRRSKGLPPFALHAHPHRSCSDSGGLRLVFERKRQTLRSNESMDNTRVFRMAFASVYPHYITKAERKGRTKEEVHAIIHWLTGYDERSSISSTR